MTSRITKVTDHSNETSGSEQGWDDDVAQNLDTFVRLSKTGHFSRANSYFEDVLQPYSDQFSILASYADSLLDQGDFGKAESVLLAGLQKYGSPLKKEKDIDIADAPDDEEYVLRLLLAIARVWTRCEWREAEMVLRAARAHTMGIWKQMPPLKLQMTVLSCRAIDLLLCIWEREPGLDLSAKDTLQSLLPIQGKSWEENIVALLDCDCIWEAQTLFSICLRHLGATGTLGVSKVLDAVPCEDDSMYKLASLTIFATCLRHWPEFAKTEAYSSFRDGWHLNIASSTHLLDDIECSITESRAFGGILLAFLGGGQNNHKIIVSKLLLDSESPWLPLENFEFWITDAAPPWETMRKTADEHTDYMFSLATYEVAKEQLPQQWLTKTGASPHALMYLHPNVEIAPGNLSLSSRETFEWVMRSSITSDVGPSPTADILDLRFHFPQYATPDIIEETAKSLKGFLESNPLEFNRISFLDHTSFVEIAARRWQDVVRRKKLAKEDNKPKERVVSLANDEAETTSLQTRLSKLPDLQTRRVWPPLSTTAVASPPVASPGCPDIPPGEKNAMSNTTDFSGGRVSIHIDVPLSFLVGCVALFGVCVGGRLLWAFGPRNS